MTMSKKETGTVEGWLIKQTNNRICHVNKFVNHLFWGEIHFSNHLYIPWSEFIVSDVF